MSRVLLHKVIKLNEKYKRYCNVRVKYGDMACVSDSMHSPQLPQVLRLRPVGLVPWGDSPIGVEGRLSSPYSFQNPPKAWLHS